MGRLVLVVDDDALVLEVTVSMLEELGCDVLQAHSEKDALDKITDDPSIEILITDINMSGRAEQNWHNALAAFATNSMSSCCQDVRVTATDIR